MDTIEILFALLEQQAQYREELAHLTHQSLNELKIVVLIFERARTKNAYHEAVRQGLSA